MKDARRPSDDYESFASDLLEQMNRFFDTQGSQKVWFAVCTIFIDISTLLLVILQYSCAFVHLQKELYTILSAVC